MAMIQYEPLVLFKDLLQNNSDQIKSYMRWDNYDLNDTVIPVTEIVKDHALEILSNSYGSFHVEQNILNNIFSDVFIHFPVLLQQLSITRLIDAYGVVKDDINTVETVRSETNITDTEQTGELTQGTSITDINTLNTQHATTGTVAVESSASNTQNSSTTIENSQGVESTGTRNVSLSHNMPEQSLNGTGNFPTDPQGTPILSNSYTQEAQEGFTTSNPINTSETSEQTISNNGYGTNDSTTTNNVTVADTGTTNRVVNNSGSDTSESTTSSLTTNNFNESVTSTMTNKQYAYEIKAFLDTADSLIAFQKWEDKFSWVVGII